MGHRGIGEIGQVGQVEVGKLGNWEIRKLGNGGNRFWATGELGSLSVFMSASMAIPIDAGVDVEGDAIANVDVDVAQIRNASAGCLFFFHHVISRKLKVCLLKEQERHDFVRIRPYWLNMLSSLSSERYLLGDDARTYKS